MFFESAEGGAGVLRRLLDDPAKLAEVAREALSICHFDPDTRRGPASTRPGATERCEAACYDCLLSYGNQRDHRLLDRHAIKDVLLALAALDGQRRRRERPAGRAPRDACAMRADSDLERRFLDLLVARATAAAEPLAEADRDRPGTPGLPLRRAAGRGVHRRPVHDQPDKRSDDEDATARLEDAGYEVLRFHHAADWEALLDAHRDVFGADGTKRVTTSAFAVGSLVAARGREWVVLPESEPDLLVLRPLGATDAEIAGILPALEQVSPATFDLPDPSKPGDARSARLLRDALRLGFRSSAGPFRSFGQIAVEPRPYQLVPLLMALRAGPGPAADRRRRRDRQDDRGGADRTRAARPGQRPAARRAVPAAPRRAVADRAARQVPHRRRAGARLDRAAARARPRGRRVAVRGLRQRDRLDRLHQGRAPARRLRARPARSW